MVDLHSAGISGDLVRYGGSAIKFAVPLDAARADVLDGLTRVAGQAGYSVIRISAADTRVHMADEIFFRTAEQIPLAAPEPEIHSQAGGRGLEAATC